MESDEIIKVLGRKMKIVAGKSCRKKENLSKHAIIVTDNGAYFSEPFLARVRLSMPFVMEDVEAIEVE